MAFADYSEWVNNFSFDEILRGDFSFLIPLFYLIISIAIYSIIIWHFYRYIAKRDCFKTSDCKYPKLVGFAKYCFGFPFVAIMFFLGFSLMLLLLTRKLDVVSILSTSFALIIAIRISAYYSEDLSKDVAKLLPFVLLGIFLVDPTYFNLDDVTNNINSLPGYVNQIVIYIIMIILVEWVLRIALTIRYKIIPKKQEIIPEKT